MGRNHAWHLAPLLTLALTGLEQTAEAADWYVPADSATVTGALALASSGDRVYVGPGTYFEHITVPTGVGLFGSGPEVSILDGSSSGTVVNVGGDDVVISGFSIRNAGGSQTQYGINAQNAGATICGNLIYWNFRGVWIEGVSNTQVLWNISADNEDDGLDGVNATADFLGNTVVSNGNPNISDGDIGIYLLSVDVRTIAENIVAHNNEYGIWCDGQTQSAYNDVFNHQNDFTSCGVAPTDFSQDPMFVAWSDDNDPRNDDFHLQAGSPCADVISSGAKDADGSDRDLGAYGGQGYDGGPRPTWSLVGEVDTIEVDPGTAVTIELAVRPATLRCDHGVDQLEISLPGFLSGLQISDVALATSPVSHQLTGTSPVVIELDEVVAQSEVFTITLAGAIPADATGSETIGVRAGMSFITAWTDGEAGDGDGGGTITTASLTVTATTGGGAGGSGAGAGSSSTGEGGQGTGGSGIGGTSSGGHSSSQGDDPSTDGSCGCRLVGLVTSSGEPKRGLGVLALAILGWVARRRRLGSHG